MLKPLTKYDPKVIGWGMHALGMTFCLLIVVCALQFVTRPLEEKINKQQQLAQSLTNFLQNSDEITKRNHQLTKEITELQQEWELLLNQIPVTAQESAYLTELSKQLDESNLVMKDFNLGSTHHTVPVKERDLTISLTGNYANLCQFLNSLDTLPRITNIQQLKVNPPDPHQLDENYIINLKLRMAFDFQDSNHLN